MSVWVVVVMMGMLVACANQPVNEEPLNDREMSLLHLADTMKRGGDTAGAIDLYKRAIAKSGKRVQAHMALADLYNQMNQPDKAVDVLLDAKRHQNGHALINLGLGKLAVARDEVDEAISYFDDGLAANPQNLDLLNGKAVALDMVGQHQQAQALYYEMIDLHDSETDFVQSNLAMSYIMSGNYNNAIAILSAVDHMEKSSVMRQNLALAYGLKGDMKNARKWGLKDLSEEEFQENIEFYKNYTQELKSRQRFE